jgi:adenosylmethionine-8-amino-7-oxononanoate aminotransferase
MRSPSDPKSGTPGPIFWRRARGANVADTDGNVYLDLTGAFGVAVAGHAHPAIVAALGHQAEALVHGMGDVHPPEIKVRLLERLAGLAPWTETRGFLANSGSEAVEAALKTALLATGRPGILAFEGGYHGLTLGSLAATHRADFRAPFRRTFTGACASHPFPMPWKAGADAEGDARGPSEQPWNRDSWRSGGRARWAPSSWSRSRGGPGCGCRWPDSWPGWPEGTGGRRPRDPRRDLHRVRADRPDLRPDWEVGRRARWCPDLLCVGKALGGGSR